MFVRALRLLPFVAGTVFAAPTANRASPTIQLDQGTFVGTSDGVTNKFLGIPFGQAPYVDVSRRTVAGVTHLTSIGICSVGNLRFNLPVAVGPYNGTQDATSYGPACPQQLFDFPQLSGVVEEAVDDVGNAIYQIITPSAEDCECHVLRHMVLSPR